MLGTRAPVPGTLRGLYHRRAGMRTSGSVAVVRWAVTVTLVAASALGLWVHAVPAAASPLHVFPIAKTTAATTVLSEPAVDESAPACVVTAPTLHQQLDDEELQGRVEGDAGPAERRLRRVPRGVP